MNSAMHKSQVESTDELRSSVRFPLELPIEVMTESTGVLRARTQNISSGGVLFDVEGKLKVGSRVEFRIDMPGGVLGTGQDVVVSCVGRVVRCQEVAGKTEAAVVIDEYSFERS
jgi:PilZ domain